ncbi:glycoside hydrolase family 3 N-terminal domain-containing protein [Chakrabartyella piscis]|uniref:glycoside hydrolase family 3 N-terminal domain-containing protein n=1 Tax=Chakrabartyella piscis TaxID=2918914 RepID=UPI002958734E|nr:glycoside hydrolase family 3 N-terminal domain-containing protein [Chakrabartyella piscis]
MKNNKWILLPLMATLAFSGCSKTSEAEATEDVIPEVTAEAIMENTELTLEEQVSALMDTMTIEEKIGQLLMCDFRTNADGTPMTELSETAAEAIANYNLGGVVLFAENLDTAEQTKTLISDIKALSDIPMFIGVDEEGGLVSRLNKSEIPHEVIPDAATLGTVEEVSRVGTVIGETLFDLGFNVDFAPVADVNTNPENTVIGTRAYSSDPFFAADMVGAFVEAIQETGVYGCVKHFPGHGDTAGDSHDGSVYVDHDLERLELVEFLPFKEGIAAGVKFVMVGHIQTPNATSDHLPATLSKESVDLLRNNLGYDGIVITDAMNMQAIVQYYGAGEACVMSILAGVDIVLMPEDYHEAYAALLEAYDTGRLTEERVDESLVRILSEKMTIDL